MRGGGKLLEERGVGNSRRVVGKKFENEWEEWEEW